MSIEVLTGKFKINYKSMFEAKINMLLLQLTWGTGDDGYPVIIKSIVAPYSEPMYSTLLKRNHPSVTPTPRYIRIEDALRFGITVETEEETPKKVSKVKVEKQAEPIPSEMPGDEELVPEITNQPVKTKPKFIK